MGRREAAVESYLVERIKALGGITRKLQYQGRTGAPDRLCILPDGTVLFVECKALGEKPRPDQVAEIETLRKYKQRALWISTREQVDTLLTTNGPSAS